MIDPLVEPIRAASRRLVRELGFMGSTLADTDLPPSAVHALVETGLRGTITSALLADLLTLDKSSVSRMVQKLVAAGLLAMARDATDARARPLSLTAKGAALLDRVNALARDQVAAALAHLTPDQGRTVLDGLAGYADALEADRTGKAHSMVPVEIAKGYRPGAIGRIAEMHAHYYARESGFGRYFESKVAAGLAAFADRLDAPCNGLWLAVRAGRIVGSIAIDGEDMAPGIAHLRWFIMDDGLRGSGTGRRLLAAALDFCDRQAFDAVHLWTFRGLDAARRLYEGAGFTLAEEFAGRQWGEEVIEQRFVRPCVTRPA